ncbi:hypothetical protein A8W25_30455 [Streptomyces sp. ERV7]|uniref:hypothetical protein n=1 Tax=Streptomyces sp. ERV7 TaxID=1322334 RepID=UPI0007F54E95|nr:hypothetical protein [Streptomyces sp. ERV7]OAR21967.1 hypothetical protein A8W25_30455 [Streptomyces sp. ERV7]
MAPTLGPEAPSAQCVHVVLGGCSPGDAEAVLVSLNRWFSSERGVTAPSTRDISAHPTVWTAMVDTSHLTGEVEPVALEETVVVNMQGGPGAVASLRDTLARAFEVTDDGTASGDQEVDVQLHLRSG